MLKRTSLLAAAAVVALAAGTAHADSYNDNRYGPGNAQSDSDQSRSYANGYSNGYEDGAARRDRNEQYRPDRYSMNHGYQRGAYYYGSDCNSSNIGGTLAGAIVGGVIGNQISDGNPGATVGGVIIGGMAGNAISSDMNCNDRYYAFSSYRDGLDGRIGHRYNWRSNQRGVYGSFTPVREYSRGGYACRDFHTVTYRNGREFERSGTACRQTDGNWYLQ
jgi:surface antigen